MKHEKVPFFYIGRDVKVQRGCLIDKWCAVSGQFDQPALVDFKAGLERILFLRGEEIEMLHAAGLFKDAVPDIGRILRLFLKQFFQIGVLDDEAARQSFVRVDIGRDWLDTRAGAAADDRNRCGRGNRHLAGETLHNAHFFGIRTCTAFVGEHHGCYVDLRADMLEEFHVP